MREFWAEVEAAPNYMVSSWGHVKNVTTGNILAEDLRNGYPYVTLYRNSIPLRRYVHQVVAQNFYEGWTEDLEVNHLDGDKTNNYVGNLEWVTHQENSCHAYETGLNPRRQRVLVVETGKIFPSLTECARAIGGHDSKISLCLSGQRKTHLGYTFERVT